ncbi:MAG: hypothetical protein WC565_09885 [Parcubacteria group bacterium]
MSRQGMIDTFLDRCSLRQYEIIYKLAELWGDAKLGNEALNLIEAVLDGNYQRQVDLNDKVIWEVVVVKPMSRDTEGSDHE